MRLFKTFFITADDFFWAGWWDIKKEGSFCSVVDGSPLTRNSYAPWGLGEPNGREIENCAAVMKNGKWKDLPCDRKTCAACCIREPPHYTMRGK